MSNKIKFTTTIFQQGNNTGIEVPEPVVQQLASGKRVAVHVSLNGFSYRSTISVMGGKYLIPLSAERRAAANVKGGDTLQITLEPDTAPREVQVPPALQQALAKEKKAQAFFDSLSYSSRLRYVLPIEQATTEETRQRRIEKTINDLKASKK